MPNMAAIFKQEISRLARREIRRQTQGLQKAAAQYRKDVAELKRRAAKLQAEVTRLGRQLRKEAASPVADTEAEGIRFNSKSVGSQRKRLGISAADYAMLIGVTAHTVYKWEHGTSRPRKRQVAAIASLRSVGKKEVLTRLKQLGKKTPKRRKKAR
jgi:DNA-binding transcriptional regulator YiaG